MFEGDEQQQQPCVMCHQQNQQMLMLSCVHDPCINCAATHYVENQPHQSQIYTCAKCGQETQLDKSSIVQLQRLYTALKKNKKVKNTPTPSSYKGPEDQYEKPPSRTRNQPLQYSRGRQPEETHGSRHYPSNPVSQPSYLGSKKPNQPLAYPCHDHPDQQLTYYCFTCNNPICPQCAIHGFHRDHEVQTTRKAIKQIKHLLVQDRQKLDLEMSEIASNREQAKRLSKQWSEQNKRDQEFIRKKLGQIKAVVNEKQKDLMRASEANLQRNIDILRVEAAASEKSLDIITSVKRNIDLTLKKEELTILQEFNKRDEEANEAVALAQREKDRLRQQQLKNPLRCVDTALLEEDIDRLIADLQALKLAANIPQS